jgi:hypothetical protein
MTGSGSNREGAGLIVLLIVMAVVFHDRWVALVCAASIGFIVGIIYWDSRASR